MSEQTPGWDAITEALEALYGKKRPRHYAAVPHYRAGGDDPLDGISVYRNTSVKGKPHWHFVTYGYSELYAKESSNPDVSGYGFEMTFRLAARRGEKEAPTWPLGFLQNLARYVFRTGNAFGEGHHVNLNGPIALGTDTPITFAVFTADPQLPARDTPNGRLRFLQAVGITAEEADALLTWNPRGLLGLLRRDSPLLVTDVDRSSILERPQVAEAVREGVEREGSSTEGLFVERLGWARRGRGKVELTLAAHVVAQVTRLLRARLLHRRVFRLWGADAGVRFERAGSPAWREEGGWLVVGLPAELVRQVAATLQPRRGVYSWPQFKAFSVRVVPGRIKDPQGKVIEVVG
jgi:suppressor of fused